MFLLVLLPALLALAIPYAILALRDSRSEVRDPQVGWKALLYFMFSVSILIALYALTALLIARLQAAQAARRSLQLIAWSPQERTALAMLTSAILVGVVHLFLILCYSNTRRFPAARRIFLGCRSAVHALVVLAAFMLLVLEFYQPALDLEALKGPVCVLLVWMPSWLCHLILLRVCSRLDVPPLGRAFPLRADEGEA
jgi:hypothetical protein